MCEPEEREGKMSKSTALICAGPITGKSIVWVSPLSPRSTRFSKNGLSTTNGTMMPFAIVGEMEMRDGKVQDAFEIDEDLLFEKSEENDYWASCFDFYYSVKGKDVADLSDAQNEWLVKIERNLNK